MAYTTINKYTDHFNTITYTGDGSSNRGITGVGFQPDWLWLKTRNKGNSNILIDAIRGENRLRSDSTAVQASVSGEFISFDTDGFTVTENASNEMNNNSTTYAAWNWKGTGLSAVTNSNGSYTSSVIANDTAGFSIVKYTGGSGAGTVGHGLSAAPELIILKPYDYADHWRVYHRQIDADAADYFLKLQSTSARGDSSDIFNDTLPTNQVFSIGSNGGVSGSYNFIAYCFRSIPGYSKVGYYAGASTPNFVYTGFRPKFILCKSSSGTNAGSQDWYIIDATRDPSNPTTKRLAPNSSSSENDNSNNSLNLLSNGFSFNTTNDQTNRNDGQSYVYLAIGQTLVGTNNIPGLAR